MSVWEFILLQLKAALFVAPFIVVLAGIGLFILWRKDKK
jgi:hypothetical protein